MPAISHWVPLWRQGAPARSFMQPPVTFWSRYWGALTERLKKPDGEATMAKVLNDIFLFFSTAAFVTGVVLAAASLLG